MLARSTSSSITPCLPSSASPKVLILAFTFIGNAVSLLHHRYLLVVLITDKMMGKRRFNTRYSEASILLVVGRMVPSRQPVRPLPFGRRFDYGSRKRFFARTAYSLPAPRPLPPAHHAELAVDRPQRAQAGEFDHAVVPYGQLRTLLQPRPETQPEGDSVARTHGSRPSKGPCVLVIVASPQEAGRISSLYGYGKADQLSLLERRCGRTGRHDAAATYTHGGRQSHPRSQAHQQTTHEDILPNYPFTATVWT